MKINVRLTIFTLLSAFCLMLLAEGAMARRYYVNPKKKKKIEIDEMAEGPERTEKLAKLVKKGGQRVLGVELIEELAWTYIKEENVEGLKSILVRLVDSKSTNIDLGIAISDFLAEKDDDLKSGIDYLYDIDWWYELERLKPPSKESSSYWNTETNKQMALIRRHIAGMYRDRGMYDAARATIYQTMLRFPVATDYQFLGELMMLDKEYQAAMGSFMTSHLLDGNDESIRFFRVAYDSLRWAPAYYDRYLVEFRKLQLEGIAEDYRLNEIKGKARDIGPLPVKEFYRETQGAVLIFLGACLSNEELQSMKIFVDHLNEKEIPHRFVSLGLHTEKLEKQIVDSGLDIVVPYHGDNLVDQIYYLDQVPTIQAIDHKGKFIFRITDAFHTLDEVFELFWNEYLEERGLTAYSE